MEDMDRMELHFSNTTHTYNPRTFSVTLVSGMDVEAAEAMMESYINCGWDLSAVHIHTDMDRNGPTVADISDLTAVLDLFEILDDNPHDVTRILAYGESEGWEFFRDWEDKSAYVAWSAADCAEEMYDNFHEELMSRISNDYFLSIDWEETARQLQMGGADFHERNGITVLFN